MAFMNILSKCELFLDSKCAFTPDANEALCANDLHVKLMQRRDRQSCGAIRANGANYAVQIESLGRELKNLNVSGYSRRVNQSGACSSSDMITSGGRKSETTMEDNINRGCMWVPGAVRYYFVLLQKQEYILQRDWSCLAEAPPMTQIRVCCVVNFTRE